MVTSQPRKVWLVSPSILTPFKKTLAARRSHGCISDSFRVGTPDVFVDLQIQARVDAVAQHPADEVLGIQLAVRRREQHLALLVEPILLDDAARPVVIGFA